MASQIVAPVAGNSALAFSPQRATQPGEQAGKGRVCRIDDVSWPQAYQLRERGQSLAQSWRLAPSGGSREEADG